MKIKGEFLQQNIVRVFRAIYKWERLCQFSRRAKVIGGWIIETSIAENGSFAINTIFIPDPEHKWELEEHDNR